jgi:DNA-binding GntR family transcriptional regulator
MLANYRFDGKVADSATEADLVRLLGASRADVRKALARAQDEGWVEKAAGYGWEFLPMVDTLEAYEDLYAVRIALEPSCLLNAKFKPIRAELHALRAEQMALVTGSSELTPIEIFESNARFHAAIASWSGNAMAIQILRRLDRIRRLAEYRQATRVLPRQELAHEHCEILDAIEVGDMLAAASLLRTHLDGARRKKAIPSAFEPANSSNS